MHASKLIQQRIQAFQQQPRMQAGSLIVTVWGDAIHPRGGAAWLGSLIQLLEPLALNERLVRTAIFRLVQDDWLQTQTVGRKTDYSLSSAGRQRIEEASRLIYGNPSSQWDAQWRIILAKADMPPKVRAALRKALYWQGFGEWNGQTFLHPSADLKQVVQGLQTEGLLANADPVAAFMSQLLPSSSTLNNQQVVAQAWDLKQLGLGYQSFLKTYTKLATALDQPVDEQAAFLLRILVVHDFRRLLLRDPMLPPSLLPAQWPGLKARHVFNQIYSKLANASEAHLDAQLKRADETGTRSGPLFNKRIQAMRLKLKMPIMPNA